MHLFIADKSYLNSSCTITDRSHLAGHARRLKRVYRRCKLAVIMGSLSRVRLSTLVQIAGGGFLVGATGLYLAQKSVQKKVRSLPHYAESLKIIATHDKAREALGTPIELGTVDLADRLHNYVDKKKSMLMVPVAGSMAAGYMEVRAVRDSPEDVFSTATIKLHLDDTIVTIYDTGAWREETQPNPTSTAAAKPASK